MVTLSIFEDGIPPVFRIQFDDKWEGVKPTLANISVTTKRTENNQVSSQVFKFTDQVSKEFYQSTEDIPEPHEFDAVLTFQTDSGTSHSFPIEFREAEDHHASDNEHHGHGHGHGHGHDETFPIQVYMLNNILNCVPEHIYSCLYIDSLWCGHFIYI